MNNRTPEYSVFLVLIQIASIGYMIMTTHFVVYRSLYIIPFEFLSFLILSWAVISMNLQTLNIFPGVRKNAVLAYRGPYKTVRHPMYLSILVFTLPLLFNQYTHFRLIAMLILTIVLIMKISALLFASVQMLLMQYVKWKR